jgi:hypothetical protein
MAIAFVVWMRGRGSLYVIIQFERETQDAMFIVEC